ncbi:MAG: hypothetical protein V3S83_12515 [Gemmatimonadota bacterium]
MREILIVGAGGYIGSRLLHKLRTEGIEPQTQDRNIYGRNDDLGVGTGDTADSCTEHFRDAVVVYLASFHREPKDFTPKDVAAYKKLMVELPCKIADVAAHTVYVSSMRSITDSESLYGKMKLMAERNLISRRATIVRPGTVWGSLDPRLPSRCNTALNFALTRRRFEGDHWQAFTTHMDLLVRYLSGVSHRNACGTTPMAPIGEIHNITDLPVPLESDGLRALLDGKAVPNTPMVQTFARELERTEHLKLDLDEDVRAQVRLRQYYGLSV